MRARLLFVGIPINLISFSADKRSAPSRSIAVSYSTVCSLLGHEIILLSVLGLTAFACLRMQEKKMGVDTVLGFLILLYYTVL